MTEEIQTKTWYQSKTIIISILEVISGIAVLIAGISTDITGTMTTGGALTIYGIMGIILRRLTALPIMKK